MISNLKLHLIRHGESVQNTKPDMIGQEPDEPLTELGEKQAGQLGVYLADSNTKFDAVYTSYYKRAHDTCHIVNNILNFSSKDVPNYPLPPRLVIDLREYSAGDMKGHKRSEVLTLDILDKMNALGMSFKFPNGESLYEVQQRAINWLYDEILSNSDMDGKEVALFSHGMTIKCLLQHIMQFDQKMTWRVKLDNTSVSTVRLKNGLWFVDSINDTRHLEKQ